MKKINVEHFASDKSHKFIILRFCVKILLNSVVILDPMWWFPWPSSWSNNDIKAYGWANFLCHKSYRQKYSCIRSLIAACPVKCHQQRC